ncbi:histidine kinase [Paenibacillus baekrokdamisoli]|uniref:Histidine kinase n=1 Tax=Paenibacillus baekrokdamisoli TaxID=1712516 RepID=A0A3G9ITG1_9BACL|nr:sensor histidine kinase [Paenibacillus baekrokdamisoli]MBB3071124.1 two-component system sensor histidine kinase YesM [Paenibacillus baekrokdamisoli]BBH21542.1 histidine kinase [Paenibacillus baekrokdamisoli]
MSFRSKLAITYTFFIAVLMFTMGTGFYAYNSFIFEKDAYARLNELTIKMSQQLDNLIQPMDYVSLDLISRSEMIDALRNLLEKDKGRSEYSRDLQESYRTLNSLAMKTLVKKEGYTINIFNEKGDFFTNSRDVQDIDVLANEITDLKWLNQARAKDGKKYIVPPSDQVWSTGSSESTFSLVRMIKDPGNEVGFIEVQNETKELSSVLSVGVDKEITVLLVNDNDEVVYRNKDVDMQSLQHYLSITENGSHPNNPVSGAPEVVYHVASSFTGWTLILIQEKASILKPLGVLKQMTAFIGAGVTLFTFIFFYVFSNRLTKPLRKLKNTMEKVRIENLPRKMVVKHENNEIEALNQSFQDMRMRLSDSINHEFKLRSMQLRAHFDSLQAQINPHFMHNMLNVLANMGMEAGAADVADTCRRISAMLRYSTSTDKRRTAIRDEVDHVDNYFYLMKKRFEHKLEFSIDVDEAMLDIEIPKIVLQPLVENAITHGFENRSGTMSIVIKGFISGNDWKIDISDNGSGFSEDILMDLETRIEHYSKQLLDHEDMAGLSIGGMGIISTFARLRLFYGEELRFELSNNDTIGACISIGGSRVQEYKGGNIVVQNHDRRR